MAIFCLLFIAISGVSASDVIDMSNNPNNNNFVSESSDLLSEESNGNYYTNQLSNEDVSSLGSEVLDNSDAEGGNVKAVSTVSSISDLTASSNTTAKASEKDTTVKSNTAKNTTATSKTTSSTKNTASKTNTKIGIINRTAYSGNPIVVILKDKDGNVLKNKKVVFNISGMNKLYTKTTNAKGLAALLVNPGGNHKATFTFDGDNQYNASKLETTIKILKSSSNIEVGNTKVERSTNFVVKLKNSVTGRAMPKKKIIFKIPQWNNKIYTGVTDTDGNAILRIDTYQKIKIIISFAGDADLNKTSTTATVTPTKCGTKILFSKNLEYGRAIKVYLRKTLTDEPVVGKKVKVSFPELNRTVTRTTNKYGRFLVYLKAFGTLNAKVSFAGDDMYTNSTKKSNFTIRKGNTAIYAPNEIGLGSKYTITLRNSNGTILANKPISIILNKKTYNKTTNAKGQFVLNFANWKKGTYPIKVSYAGNKYYYPSTLSKNFKISDPAVSISKIIAAARDLKTRVEYINLLNKSYSVDIDNKKYTLDEFAYLMAGAITHLNAGSKANVIIKDLSNNYNSGGNKINGKLSKSEYLKLAANVTRYVNSKMRLPNYSHTNLGKMEADLYTYAFCSILDYYAKNKKLPSSVSVNTNNVRGGYSYSINQGGKILNCREIFDSTTFAKYLETGGKSALNDAIISKAKSLTAGLTDSLSKAIAIFRYVRDGITYSFYSNSLKGAFGTLSSKSGNCCDKANLIVAMCRAVGVYARYSHAQGCRFSSGLYTGHVWAQVYDTRTQTWYTADATSYRNEVGVINNWNTGSYYRANNYVLIPF